MITKKKTQVKKSLKGEFFSFLLLNISRRRFSAYNRSVGVDDVTTQGTRYIFRTRLVIRSIQRRRSGVGASGKSLLFVVRRLKPDGFSHSRLASRSSSWREIERRPSGCLFYQATKERHFVNRAGSRTRINVRALIPRPMGSWAARSRRENRPGGDGRAVGA